MFNTEFIVLFFLKEGLDKYYSFSDTKYIFINVVFCEFAASLLLIVLVIPVLFSYLYMFFKKN